MTDHIVIVRMLEDLIDADLPESEKPWAYEVYGPFSDADEADDWVKVCQQTGIFHRAEGQIFYMIMPGPQLPWSVFRNWDGKIIPKPGARRQH